MLLTSGVVVANIIYSQFNPYPKQQVLFSFSVKIVDQWSINAVDQWCLIYNQLCKVTHEFIPTFLAVQTRFHGS